MNYVRLGEILILVCRSHGVGVSRHSVWLLMSNTLVHRWFVQVDGVRPRVVNVVGSYKLEAS